MIYTNEVDFRWDMKKRYCTLSHPFLSFCFSAQIIIQRPVANFVWFCVIFHRLTMLWWIPSKSWGFLFRKIIPLHSIYFVLTLTFEMLTLQHSFSTHEWMCLWSVQVLEIDNFSTWGGLEPPNFGFMRHALITCAISARHLLAHVFEYWLWWHRYFRSKVNIWNINCAPAAAFIFDSRTDVFVKVSKFKFWRKRFQFSPFVDSNMVHGGCCEYV